MGVTGLWTVVQPCARPIKIETLNKKRLAVDASIWIYQFLKAVRDKEGNALRNSHVVGFFRRICKLLFFGIRPVFVFDGGAPALKRQTISGRKARREGRREDAVRTAGKLLAVQMQRRAEEEERRRREERARPAARDEDEEPLPENLVYVDELHMTNQERQQSRKFKRKDAYHLPDLDVSLAEMGAPNDPRIMSLEELEQYARQFDTGEDINVYDFSKIDFDSTFFTSLPASDRYNILNAARLRSRLRMGYSKDQLDTMFPDRMAFSRFQIERVRERNELTQRLMNINGMGDDGTFGAGLGRVAGEKGREYVLVKNDGVEGGWALGVVSSKDEGQRDKPIDVDQLDQIKEDEEQEEWEDEEDFEDIPIEGLNRLPRRREAADEASPARNLIQRRQRLYKSRQQEAPRRQPQPDPANDDPDSLFVANDEDDGEWEDVAGANAPKADTDGEHMDDEEARDLQRAIEMSLENEMSAPEADRDEDDYEEVFNQQKVPEAAPFTKGSGMAIAKMANIRSNKATATKGPFDDSDSDDDGDDLYSAPAQSRSSTFKPQPAKQSSPSIPKPRPRSPPKQAPKSPTTAVAKAAGFDGPLPFEKLDLGCSLLGKKKMKKLEEDASGGFEKDAGKEKKKQQAVPLPPWFASNMQEDMNAQKVIEEKDREEERRAKEQHEDGMFQLQQRSRVTIKEPEIIDLEAESGKDPEVIDLESNPEESPEEDAPLASEVFVEDPEIRMGDLADKIRAEPPKVDEVKEITPPKEHEEQVIARKQNHPTAASRSSSPHKSDEEMFEWSESDEEADQRIARPTIAQHDVDVQGRTSPSASPEFEDVPMGNTMAVSAPPEPPEPELLADKEDGPVPASGLTDQYVPIELDDEYLEMPYSDPEDEELFRQLAQEEEEHARFASTLNNRPESDPVDYEKELRQLRNQQKKDRRDADEVTQVMIQECKQLLSLFGLPYVTAPMEAEAQCAELVHLGLVDGIVTDDSDIFLFGGTRVYKNMFNQAKFVECYLEQDLQSEFALTRERLIGIAQLLGSDYTEGLPGVGPVTALEIMSEFDDLRLFKDWWTEVQTGARSKADDAGNAFRKKFRRNATKLFLPPSFPDPRVEQAYLKPEVDSDPHPFVWGVPDLDALRGFLMSTIGWSQERTDEILVPVIKDMNRRMDEGTQSNITNFFAGGVGAGAFAPRRREEGKSKRLETALQKMKQRARIDTLGEGEDDAPEETNGQDANGGATNGEDTAGPNKTAKTASKAKGKKRGKRSTRTDMTTSEEDEEEYVEPRKKKKVSRKRT